MGIKREVNMCCPNCGNMAFERHKKETFETIKTMVNDKIIYVETNNHWLDVDVFCARCALDCYGYGDLMEENDDLRVIK